MSPYQPIRSLGDIHAGSLTWTASEPVHKSSSGKDVLCLSTAIASTQSAPHFGIGLFQAACCLNTWRCVSVYAQPIFQQLRAMSHHVIQCCQSDSDVTNRPLLNCYPILLQGKLLYDKKMQILEYRPQRQLAQYLNFFKHSFVMDRNNLKNVNILTIINTSREWESSNRYNHLLLV